MITNVYIASDHAGFELKNKLVSYITEIGFKVVDLGPYEYNENDDYPKTLKELCEKTSSNKNTFSIVLGGSGTGEAIVSNKYKNVRSALFYGGNLDIVKLSRTHNNANVLSLGARFINEEEAKEAVKIFLNTTFLKEERHMRRIKEIENLEDKSFITKSISFLEFVNKNIFSFTLFIFMAIFLGVLVYFLFKNLIYILLK
jgi:ribose 5-phosphate isomerase B